MIKSMFLLSQQISAILLSINFSLCANYERDSNVDHQLNFNRRSFIKFIDEVNYD